MNAQYSQPAAARAASPVTINQAFFMAASVFDSGGLATLRSTAPGPARIEFDLRQVPLRAQETNRTISNLGVILVGNTDKTFQGKLRATLSPTEVSFPITGGYVISNAGLLLGTNTPLPLNGLVGLPVNQPLTLEIDRTGVANELRALFDVVLYVEYQPASELTCAPPNILFPFTSSMRANRRVTDRPGV